jgi:diacylglycerol kinase
MATKSSRSSRAIPPQNVPAQLHTNQTGNPPTVSQPLNFHTNINFWRGRVLSFVAAWEGVVYVIRTQPNVWIELTALGAVAIVGLFFGLSALEWGLLALTVAVIVALEAVNTAIETVVDLVSPTYHPLAKIAKDTAAAALLIAVLGSVVVALCIFGPKLWALLA